MKAWKLIPFFFPHSFLSVSCCVNRRVSSIGFDRAGPTGRTRVGIENATNSVQEILLGCQTEPTRPFHQSSRGTRRHYSNIFFYSLCQSDQLKHHSEMMDNRSELMDVAAKSFWPCQQRPNSAAIYRHSAISTLPSVVWLELQILWPICETLTITTNSVFFFLFCFVVNRSAKSG